MEKMVTLKLNWKEWMHSYETARVVIDSPKGGSIELKKSRSHLRNLMEADEALHQKLLRHMYFETMQASVEEMKVIKEASQDRS